MTKNDMHDDDRQDDTYDTPEEDTDHGLMHVLKEKVGLGYVAFGILVVVIVLLGAREKIMGYFVKTPEVAQATAWAAGNQPVMPSERAMPTQSGSQGRPVDSGAEDTNSQSSMMPADGQAAVNADNTLASNDSANNSLNNTVAIPDRNAAMTDDKTDGQAAVNADNTLASNNSANNSLNNTVAIPDRTLAMTEDKMKQAVKDFIMNNPEVIMESLSRFQQKRMQESKEYVTKSADKLVSGKPFIGNADGTLVITEFFDYRCTYCKKVYPDLLKLIKEYPDLKIVLVELPYGGATSTKAVKFSLAVNALYPEQFYNFHTGLLNAASIDDKVIYALISQYNMDKAKLIEKANSEEIEKIISQNLEQATKAGVQGVPSFLINSEFVQGAASYSEFKKRLDAIKKG